MEINSKPKKKSRKRAIYIISVAVILFVAVFSVRMLFRSELKIINSMIKVIDDKPVYYMEVNGDYHFDEFLQSGGAASDREVSAFLTNKMSKGFYSVELESAEIACGVVSAETPDGGHIWGRNYDWYGSVPILVRCAPTEGYSSISTCDFQTITGNAHAVPEGMINKLLSIAALYVPMDGINEAGLCVADLQVNEGGMVTADTDKPDLTVTTAIRLLLNKAATVHEAVELLESYDIYPSGGISHHLAISDAAGGSVVIEFAEGGMTVVNTNCVTNFNLAKGDPAAGGESAKQRYETLCSIYQSGNGVLTHEQVKRALRQTSQGVGEWSTQWSIVYDQDILAVDYYFYGDYENAYRFQVGF